MMARAHSGTYQIRYCNKRLFNKWQSVYRKENGRWHPGIGT